MSGEGFTDEQIRQLRQIVGEAFADAGLRVDGEHQTDAREDLRFLRRLRKSVDGTAGKIGWVIILAILGGFIWIFTQGLALWNKGV